MKIRPLLTALFAATAFSPPSIQSRIAKPSSITSTYCIPVPRRHAFATIVPRVQRARPHEVSLSPPALANSGASASSNVTKSNTSTSSARDARPPLPAWVLTLDDILTAIFRILITILTLFNVNITWRIRGELWTSTPNSWAFRADVSNS